MKRIHAAMSFLGVSLAGAFLLLAQSSTNPVPLINEPLAPAAVAPGSGAFTLTVTGTGFVSGSVVHWNGSARTTTFVNSSKLTASILTADVASASTASVSVVSPTPGGGESNVVFLPVTTSGSSVGMVASTIFDNSGTTAVGDFNGDGKLDLVVTDPAGVQILLGNGDGTFQAPVLVPVAGGTVTPYLSGPPIVEDFNGDGKPDIVAINGSQTAVTVLLGNGDGTFQAPINSRIDTSIMNPSWLAAGDLNGDGRLDLVVSYQGTKSLVTVLLGNGDGSFQPFVDYPSGGENISVAVGDFNGDGKLDLVTVNSFNTVAAGVSVLLGNGDGTFQSPVAFAAVPSVPVDVLVADFNGDGKLDLAVGGQCGGGMCGTSTVAILLGNGDGTFQAPVLYDTDGNVNSMVAADFNGDGKLDLGIADYTASADLTFSGKITFLLGKGDGTFQPHFGFATIAHPFLNTSGDFNNDGLLDLVLSGSNPNPAGGATPSVNLLKQTVGPAVALSSGVVDFGTQSVGSTSGSQMVTLSDSGRAALMISSISMNGANGSDFAANTGTCLSGVAAGANCTLTFTFTPSALGARGGLLSITDNAGDSPQTIQLKGTGSDFEIDVTPGSSSTATVTAGSAATYSISLIPDAGFNQTINLSCSGAPAAASCTPSSPSVTLDGTSAQSVTVKVTTTARGMLPPDIRPRDWPWNLMRLLQVWIVALMIVLGLLGTRRLRPQTAFGLLVLCIISSSLAACGGGSSGPPPPTGTPAGTYTLTVTGTSGSLSHKTTVTLTVN